MKELPPLIGHQNAGYEIIAAMPASILTDGMWAVIGIDITRPAGRECVAWSANRQENGEWAFFWGHYELSYTEAAKRMLWKVGMK